MINELDLSLKKELVKKQTCFSQLTDEETTILSSLLKENRFAAGDTIVTEGESVDSAYIIVSGKADVRITSRHEETTKIQSVAVLGEGDSIGLNETGFYSLSGIRTATVIALTDMVLIRLNIATFHGFALAYPHVCEVMRKQASQFLGFGNLNDF